MSLKSLIDRLVTAGEIDIADNLAHLEEEPAESARYWGKNGAGVLLYCKEDNTILLTLRSHSVEQPGTWGIPGGAVKDVADDMGSRWRENFHDSSRRDDAKSELPEELFRKGGEREAVEELGGLPNGLRPHKVITYKDGSFTYKTFVDEVSLAEKQRWTPSIELNWENDAAEWFALDDLPEPLHFGTTYVLQKMGW